MSSYVDEDTARAVEAGRETAVGALQSVQHEVKKIFLVFVAVFLGTVIGLRIVVWDFLKANTESQMSGEVAEATEIIAITPFDVILMQVKVGLIVGAVAGAITGLYLARKNILGRVEQRIEVTAPRLYGFVAMSALLAVVGITYAYGVFFPLMFNVLAEQAYNAGAQPNYGIVHYTEFLLLLTISFGIAAQLPLLMGVLAFSEIVPYETFRDKWRYAVLGIFVFGAVFSPPDPFTQILWAIPLVALYAFSLGIAKVVTNVHRAGEHASPIEDGTFRWKGYQIAGGALLAFLAIVVGHGTGIGPAVGESVLAALPDGLPIPLLGELSLPTEVLRGGPADWIVWGLQTALLVGGVLLAYHLVDVLRMPVVSRQYATTSGAPEDLDLGALDAAGVRAAPPQAFAALSEDEAVEIAGAAMEAGEEEKGTLVLERWQSVEEGGAAAQIDFLGAELETVRTAPPESFATLSEDEAIEIAGEAMEAGDDERGKLVLRRWEEADEVGVAPPADELDLAEADVETVRAAPDALFAELTEDEAIDLAGEAMEAGNDEKGSLLLQRWEEADQDEDETGDESDAAVEDESDDPFEDGILAGTTAGVFDAFSADDRDEDELGGYLYDVGFIIDSLRSRLFVVFGVFMSVFVGTFAYLYTIGIDQIITVFTAYVANDDFEPAQQVEGANDVLVALHPVEVLIFIVKFSGVLAFMVTLPLLLYFTWPALQERRFVPGDGDRRGFLVWGGALLATTLLGSAVGFFGFAPAVISYLINDGIDSGMVISYRVRSLLWIVFYMTIGFGMLLNIPIGMVVLHYMDLVRLRTFRRWWRQIVLGIFVIAMVATPGGVLTMILFAIPLGFAFVLGLAVLWTITAPAELARTVANRIRAVGR